MKRVNTTSMDQGLIDELDEAYENWVEAEQKNKVHSDVMSSMRRMKESGQLNANEIHRQQTRLKYSAAYFSGHPASTPSSTDLVITTTLISATLCCAVASESGLM